MLGELVAVGNLVVPEAGHRSPVAEAGTALQEVAVGDIPEVHHTVAADLGEERHKAAVEEDTLLVEEERHKVAVAEEGILLGEEHHMAVAAVEDIPEEEQHRTVAVAGEDNLLGEEEHRIVPEVVHRNLAAADTAVPELEAEETLKETVRIMLKW